MVEGDGHCYVGTSLEAWKSKHSEAVTSLTIARHLAMSRFQLFRNAVPRLAKQILFWRMVDIDTFLQVGIWRKQ